MSKFKNWKKQSNKNFLKVEDSLNIHGKLLVHRSAFRNLKQTIFISCSHNIRNSNTILLLAVIWFKLRVH